QVAAWMLGKMERPDFVKGSDSPLWMRDYSETIPKEAACAALQDALSAMGAKRMVVGHTIQDQGINAACGDKVWRIDVGLSKYYKKNVIQVLEIKGDSLRVLSAPR
ncbi:MAG: hypothetical protein M3Q07_24015, partial [Pseudobdellovibrionaceae bacterium]|nr:hypothetical protein [Pseudobdellovibrionaceae bacterium]